jgi:Asp-tRNA(Asn)/Glu-tRNA(Gln) amidotransferase A subunit family amidase
VIGKSALDIAAEVRRGATSAVAEVEAALDRAAAAADLNIFTLIDADRAMANARAVDAALAADPSSLGPLPGVPFVVKDLIDQAGLPNTCGAGFAPYVPAVTAPCVARLEAAGAIPIGRVGLHEFAFGFSSENPWFGPVHNPLDPRLSPGGSSGGSAAAVAAGIAPLALGTDTGGSVRVPAALCGIVGLKVTHGRGSIRGVYPLAGGLDTVGPLAGSVADAEAAYRVIAPFDPDDPHSIDRPVDGEATPADLSSLRLAVPHPWVDTGYEARIEVAFDSLLTSLQGAGVTVEHVTIPETAPPGQGLASAYYEIAPIHRARFLADPDAYGPDLQVRLRDALAVTADEYEAALEWRSRLRDGLVRAMNDFDAIITPTTAAVSKVIGDEQIELTNGPTHYRGPLSHFSAPVNNAGLPALSLPVRGTGTPPLSVQLVGTLWSERQLMGIGRALENSGIC